MTVNCTQYDDGDCLAGHYRGRPPAVACHVCQYRQAIVAGVRAVPLLNRYVSICPERLAEEWAGEWLDKIGSAIVGRTDKRVTLPAAFYAEAVKHRRGRQSVAT